MSEDYKFTIHEHKKRIEFLRQQVKVLQQQLADKDKALRIEREKVRCLTRREQQQARGRG